MGLLTGLVFSVLNFVFAMIPVRYAQSLPARKLAAVGALMAGAFYLALSGGNVATERAFIMVAVMFLAVILGRRALTLRAVAVAALIVLTLRPEVLTEPGFQMSFAATVALVAVFGEIRTNNWRLGPRWMAPVATVVMSSLVAGLATAPVAAAHFNRIADYGLLANLACVPLMGLIVMPAALGAIVLAPLGLSSIGFAIMRPAISWILGVADWVSSLDGALSYVLSPPALAMPLIAFGGVWLVLWQGKRLRLAGISGLIAGFALWAAADRPVALISPDGGLVGVLTEQGRALSKPKGSGFAARAWLENDGDGADQFTAAKRAGFEGEKGHILFGVGTTRFTHLSGRGARDKVVQSCASTGHVFLSTKYEGARPMGCEIFDQIRLRETGSIAIHLEQGTAKLITATEFSGKRLWNNKPLRAKRNHGVLAMLGG
jgi:competence protein ComEC